MKYDLEWLNNIIPANNNRVNDVLYSNEKVFEEKNKIDDTRFLTKIKLLVLNKESNKEKFNMKSICKELKIAYFKMSEGHYPQCKEYIINSSNYFRRNKVKIES